MFEVDQGLGTQWQAHGAPPLEPGLGYRPERRDYGRFANAGHDMRANQSGGRRKMLLGLALVLMGVAGLWLKLVVLPAAGPMAADASSLRAQLDKAARLTGFGIDMVVLTGHQFTVDSDIFDALDLPNARSLVSFDTDGVRARLERLPWVLSADLTRVFPDRLDVRISERKSYAVWIRDGRAQVIDRSGRILSAVHRSDGLDLPRISGDGAGTEADAFLTLVARYRDVWARLSVAERVAERRWTLHLTDGVTVHLPPDREAAVLESLTQGGRFAHVIVARNRIIDMRTAGRIAVRQELSGAGPDGETATPAFFNELGEPG